MLSAPQPLLSPGAPDGGRNGLVDADTAMLLFGIYNLARDASSTPNDIDEFIRRFSEHWRAAGHADAPAPDDVRAMMDDLDVRLIAVWRRLGASVDLPVCLVSVPRVSNPFVIKHAGNDPLIVMCLGLWGLVFGTVLGLLTYVADPPDEDRGLDFARAAMKSWAHAERSFMPDAPQVQALSTRNLQDTTTAVGLAHCALTWAYFHEVAHVLLGHVGSDAWVMRSVDDEALALSASTYSHAEELEADKAGIDALLALMDQEQDIRRSIEFGPSGDHAASILFDIMDLAYRLHPERDRRASTTHPPPALRSEQLRRYTEGRCSADGIAFYEDWRGILGFVERSMRLA